MTSSVALFELQRLDTTLDQLRHRRANLAERAALAAAQQQRAAWAERSAALAADSSRYEGVIAEAEAAAAEITAQRTRLERQLKTVIVSREAEALMHEIDTLTGRRSELDDRELEALEALSTVQDDQRAHEALQGEIDGAVAGAEQATRDAEALVDGEIAQLRAERDALAGTLEPADLARYDELRARFGGVAIATLNGRTCTGCHLDLSAVELEAVRAAAPDEMPECPQCGRLLAR